jgi:phosphoribosyl 1,2-cyclic phosphodiesterase
MKLTFLGTRGYIDARTRRHRRHSALLAAYKGRTVMIDCGEDWAGRLDEIAPGAIFVTHAHPDHAWGLKGGTHRPVYATEDSWRAMADYPITRRHVLEPRRPVTVATMRVEAFAVVHSLRAPAVGYRLSAGRVSVFYVPDVIDVHERAAALAGIRLFVGDGASLTRPLVRRKGDALFGHTTIRAQLGWCQKAGVPRAIFTHCGRQIVTGDERTSAAKVRAMGRERGVEASIAHDGLEVVLR